MSVLHYLVKEVNNISNVFKKISHPNLYFISSYWYSDHGGKHYKYEYAYYVVA